MMKPNFEVKFLPKAEEFLLSLEAPVKEKAIYVIQRSRIANDSKFLKKIDSELWEFRIRYQKQQIRLLSFWDKKHKALIICTHGLFKKTQKLRKSEIELAKQLMKEYYEDK